MRQAVMSNHIPWRVRKGTKTATDTSDTKEEVSVHSAVPWLLPSSSLLAVLRSWGPHTMCLQGHPVVALSCCKVGRQWICWRQSRRAAKERGQKSQDLQDKCASPFHCTACRALAPCLDPRVSPSHELLRRQAWRAGACIYCRQFQPLLPPTGPGFWHLLSSYLT